MAESAANAYATNSSNQAASTPNPVAVVNDGTGDRQIVVLGSGDGTTNIQDGSLAHPLNVIATVATIAVGNFPTTQVVSGSVTIYGEPAAVGTVYQGGAPWLVNASIIGQIPVTATIATINVGLNSVLATVVQGGAFGVTATVGNTVNVAESGAWGVTATVGNTINALATVTQGTTPWLVNASIVGQQAVTASISGTPSVLVASTVTVNQGTNPWLVSATVGTPSVLQGTSPWLVNASVVGIPNINASIIGVPGVIASVANFPASQTINGSVTIYGSISAAGVNTVYQAGAPWLVNASIIGTPTVQVSTIVTLAIGSMPAVNVNVSQVFQGAAPWLVNASVIGNIPVTATVPTLVIGLMPAISVTATNTTVFQGGAPWSVTGSVGSSQQGTWTFQPGNTPNTVPWLVTATVDQGSPFNVTATIGNIPAVSQSGAPWTVNASIQGIPNVNASIQGVLGVIATVLQGTSPWLVNASLVGIQSVNASIIGVQNVIATVLQGTSPWLVNSSIIGTVPVQATVITFAISAITATISNTVNIIAASTVTVAQGTSPWLVNASVVGQLGVTITVATLTVGSQNATVYQGTSPWLVNASIIGILGVNATYAAPWNVTVTEAGTVNTFSLPQTSGGLSVFQNNLSATTVTLKSSAGQIYGYHIFNYVATQAYVNFYAASVATVGLTAPFMQLGIPASGGATFDSDIGITFTTPIMVSATASLGGVGTVSPGVSVNVFYK